MKRLLTLLLLLNIAVRANGAAAPAAAIPTVHFSEKPTTAEIAQARIFDEPLIPMGGTPTAAENKALGDALIAYAGRSASDNFSSLTGFLDAFPQSPWTGSLLLHLGAEYNNSGYYSKALAAWVRAWQISKNVQDSTAKAQADRTLGELARLYSKVGRMGELAELLNTTSNRALTGPGTQLIGAARQALWLMQNHPQVTFRCGPLALERILSQKGMSEAAFQLVANSKSTTNGFSLSQVAALSQQLGMNYQMAFRNPGAQIVTPAVIHWKVGHYAALIRQVGDRFLVQDKTFRKNIWMTESALNTESSGYFLVPLGPLPTGWRSVGNSEAQQVWGKGDPTSQYPGATSPYDTQTPQQCPLAPNQNANQSPMTTYNMHTMLVSLTLKDTPEGYAPPVGPSVHFAATYNQSEAGQPATFYFSNLGPKWTCNWISFITDDPQSPNADVSWYVDGGGTLQFNDFNPTNQTYAVELMSQATLTKKTSSSYEMLFPDGSKKEFAQSDGATGTTRRIFLTKVIDPAGNAVQLNYDSLLRITNIVDAIGQATTLQYTNAAFPQAITSVTDPFDRATYLSYYTNGLLAQITDVLGITSQYFYGANDFVSTLVTPYGATQFATGAQDGGSFLQATDPLGESEYMLLSETLNFPPDVEAGQNVPHGLGVLDQYINYRNSYYWDKKAYADGAGDLTKATIYHFLHEPGTLVESPVLESVKKPLENRVWFNYPGQTTYPIYLGANSINKPIATGRVLDDGTSQVYYYGYNAFGNQTNAIDPVGRSFSYVYATNNIDLLQVAMTHNGKYEVQFSAAYNAQHLPLTITDAAGQTTTNTFNANGQLLSTINPKGEITTFSYATNGYLLCVTGHLQNASDVISFTYDGFGRVRTATDTEGYALTNAYDAFDRKTQIAHPDGTTEQFVYNLLDLAATKDRLGRWTTNTYNADRQLVQTRDPLGRTTMFDWCKCGALTGLTDPMGRTTSWDYDVESRPIAKHYVDGSTVTYIYEDTTSRLKSKFDEKGQQTLYAYYEDNNLKQVIYPNAAVATPTVSFTYDPDYNRVLTMQDGIGTTVYAYNPITAIPALGAGMLASVNGPLPNSMVTYAYDALSRATNRAINGVAQTTTFDVLDRPITITNALGTFQNGFVDATARLAFEGYPNGQSNSYAYYNTFGDERLERIQHFYPNGSLLSGFGYAFNAVGQIIAWTNQWDSIPVRVWLPAYDAADQLTNIISTGGPSPVTNYAYAYDPDGNRLMASTNGVQNSFSYNALNQLTTDAIQTNTITYEWDAENRLTAINNGTHRSEFFYDGLGRRSEILEFVNGSPVNTNFYLWCGTSICEQRDLTGAIVTRRFFSQGEQLGQAGSQLLNYYYTRDHVKSVCEATDSTGTLQSRIAYGPNGERNSIISNEAITFGYAGFLYHSSSGFSLALFRVLDSNIGRWLSRDPDGEVTGVDLYKFVNDDPINLIDPNGLRVYVFDWSF